MAERRIAGNQATGFLKVAALVFMLCDHLGKMVFPNIPEMRMLGRIAFPLYAWCLVVGFCYTRSVPKYMLRLLLVGLVSQPLYMLALNHTWREPNIFLTLLLALGGLWGMREKRWLSQLWAPALALTLAVALRCDYGWRGVALIWMLYAARTSRPALAAVMAAFCLYWGTSSSAVNALFGLSLHVPGAILPTLLQPWLRLQALAILALPLILWRCPIRWKIPSWLGYALYPAHLLLIILLVTIM